MIRLLGVISGSAIAIAALLLFIGIPQFRSETVQPERPPVRLPRQTQPVEQAAPTPEPATGPETRMQDAAAADTSPGEQQADASSAAAAVSGPQAPPDDVGGSAAGQEMPPPAPEAAPDEPDGWYVFWSPFRSRIAAEGFVARLQSVTGLDYRIVRRKPGAYEVSFPYSDDDDIVRHLSQISAATGLDLPERP